jgi:hypothetical protein
LARATRTLSSSRATSLSASRHISPRHRLPSPPAWHGHDSIDPGAHRRVRPLGRADLPCASRSAALPEFARMIAFCHDQSDDRGCPRRHEEARSRDPISGPAQAGSMMRESRRPLSPFPRPARLLSGTTASGPWWGDATSCSCNVNARYRCQFFSNLEVSVARGFWVGRRAGAEPPA